MEKPIYEKIEYLGEKLYRIILTDSRVVDVVLESDDIVADFDFMVSFRNTDNVKKEIIDLVKKIETDLKCIKVKTLEEQIQDVMNENEDIITVDFYCTINL